jgi:ubiquinone/menaquinone biosynthesis C-methylase UbiE
MNMPAFDLVCPTCAHDLGPDAVCHRCGRTYKWLREGKLISFQDSTDTFYETCYAGQWRKPSHIRLPVWNLLLGVRQRLSLSNRRERFFRRHLDGSSNLVILDVACGYGRNLFKRYGRVVGLDVVLDPLCEASDVYDLCIHANAFSIPFPNEYFDCIVSSDFLGHVPIDTKDTLYQEFRRVLKLGGTMLHVLETDAKNRHFRFAHRYPDLFQKYFVEGIGGHFGLELPSQALQRFESNGFRVVEARKIWGEIWEIEGYKMVFDNEYREKSGWIRAVVIMSRILSSNILVREAVNVLLNPVSALAEQLTPLDNGQGLMVVCKKA